MVIALFIFIVAVLVCGIQMHSLGSQCSQLERDRDALEMTLDECRELLDEARWCIHGLAEEMPVGCKSPCGGHFGPKAEELYHRGLSQWHKMTGLEHAMQAGQESEMIINNPTPSVHSSHV